MASKDKSATTGSGRSGSGGPKRPRRTIDLEAQEVEDEAAADASGDADKPEAAEPATEQAGETAGAGDTGDAGSARPATEPADGDESDPSEPRAQAGAKRSEPPPRAGLADVRAFFTHLAAGLVGGLIGVVAAGVGLGQLPVGALLEDAEREQTQLRELAGRLDALDARVASNAQALDAAAQSEAVDSLKARVAAVEPLESRIAALEDAVSGASAASDDLAGRIDRLDARLKSLGEAAQEGGPGGVAQAAALSGEIEDIRADLESRLAALDKELAGVKQTVESRPERPAGASEADLAALGEKLAALESRVNQLENRPAPQTRPDGTAALAVAFDGLRRAVDRGEPFAQALARVRRLAPDGLDFSALAAHAESGVATREALRRALPGAVRTARKAGEAPPEQAGSFIDRLVSNAQSVVRVRRVGGAGEDDGALSRVESAMEAGDLAGALAASDKLEGAALEAMRPWLDRARARRDAERGLEDLESRLIAALQAADTGAPG